MKILISAFSNLYTDQRIEKVCGTLHENGYSIELIGNNWGGEEPMNRPYPFSRISLKSKSLKTAYLEFNWKLYRILKQKADKDTILLANDLDALLPNYLVSKKLNIPLVFDSHEIFSELPAIQNRLSQKFWRFLESKLVPKIRYMMTASESYAEWFANHYPVKPVVVQNFPKKIELPFEFPSNHPKIILYQGAINPFRGIDKMIKSMHLISDAEFHIAGDGPKKKEYEELVLNEKLSSKVKFLGRLHPEQLRNITQKADAGLSIEENGGISYYNSLPNKVSDYIQAGLPVVLINFPEMRKIMERFNVGEIIENHQPETLAKAVETVLKNGRKFYSEELNRASETLCWEQEEPKLLDLFRKATQ